MENDATNLQEASVYARNLVDIVRDPLLILDGDLRPVCASRAFRQMFQATASDTDDPPLPVWGQGRWRIPELATLLAETVTKRDGFDDFEWTTDLPVIGRRTLLLNGRRLLVDQNRATLLALSF